MSEQTNVHDIVPTVKAIDVKALHR
jgi:hypothetical protein